MRPWGRIATFGLGLIALLAGQLAALAALGLWYGQPLSRIPGIGTDGIAVSLFVCVSTPVEVALMMLFARRAGPGAGGYLGWSWPRRGDMIFGIVAAAAFIVASNAVSLAVGRPIVTAFQVDLYRSASAQGALPLLWLAVVAVTPIGEETLFRGFLFRGWMRSPRDAWPTIAVTSLLFALAHVQYDGFVMVQVFAFGLLLGWMRWASGSTALTMVLHALVNLEGMVETLLLHG